MSDDQVLAGSLPALRLRLAAPRRDGDRDLLAGSAGVSGGRGRQAEARDGGDLGARAPAGRPSRPRRCRRGARTSTTTRAGRRPALSGPGGAFCASTFPTRSAGRARRSRRACEPARVRASQRSCWAARPGCPPVWVGSPRRRGCWAWTRSRSTGIRARGRSSPSFVGMVISKPPRSSSVASAGAGSSPESRGEGEGCGEDGLRRPRPQQPDRLEDRPARGGGAGRASLPRRPSHPAERRSGDRRGLPGDSRGKGRTARRNSCRSMREPRGALGSIRVAPRSSPRSTGSRTGSARAAGRPRAPARSGRCSSFPPPGRSTASMATATG